MHDRALQALVKMALEPVLGTLEILCQSVILKKRGWIDDREI